MIKKLTQNFPHIIAIVAIIFLILGVSFVYNQAKYRFIQSPEATLNAFIQALEQNDAPLALGYFAPSVQATYEPILLRADLQSLANSLREYPPARLDTPTADDKFATFLTRRLINGELIDVRVELHWERFSWKIIGF